MFYKLISAIAPVAIILLATCLTVRAAEPLVVHEWGTFTALQDESGKGLTGINIDDEVLPSFVHNLNPLANTYSPSAPLFASKGAPEKHPFVTLRLETPVLYFYPPKGMSAPFDVDVEVNFHGGWLTEFYPQAVYSSSDSKDGNPSFGEIKASTLSKLSWNKLQVGGDAAGPKTESPIWLPPRKVRAANVTMHTKEGAESEKYLFYRGVGNFDAPLITNLDRENNRLTIHANFAGVAKDDASLPIGPMWLVRVRADHSAAYRTIDAGRATRDPKAVVAASPVKFDNNDYREDNLHRLRKDMHAALVADGLFEDEATAMLDTWQNAYFRSPGLRLFCLVPQPWTDDRLPLKISREAQIRRVMVARVELIDESQRQILKELSTSKISRMDWIAKVKRTAATDRFFDDHSDFGDLGVEIPADYKLYLKLGRFRNALLIAEEKARRTPALTEFINNYGLWQFRPE